jgi:hypothetical protein
MSLTRGFDQSSELSRTREVADENFMPFQFQVTSIGH